MRAQYFLFDFLDKIR